jgi:hypothetical protein
MEVNCNVQVFRSVGRAAAPRIEMVDSDMMESVAEADVGSGGPNSHSHREALLTQRPALQVEGFSKSSKHKLI